MPNTFEASRRGTVNLHNARGYGEGVVTNANRVGPMNPDSRTIILNSKMCVDLNMTTIVSGAGAPTNDDLVGFRIKRLLCKKSFYSLCHRACSWRVHDWVCFGLDWVYRQCRKDQGQEYEDNDSHTHMIATTEILA